MSSVALVSSSGGDNYFNELPAEIIQNFINPFLAPQDILSMRRMDRRFAQLFGDNQVWRIYYQKLGMNAPANYPATSGIFPLSYLAKDLSLWKSFKEAISLEVANTVQNHYRKPGLRGLCIAVIALPELSSLHAYAHDVLESYCDIPKGLSKEKLFLRIVEKNEGYTVDNAFSRLLALKAIGHLRNQPEVKQAMLSLITSMPKWETDGRALCEEAMQCLIPCLTRSELKETVLKGLKRHEPYPFMPAFDLLLPDSEILDAIINRYSGGLCGLDAIVQKHLDKPEVVNQLLQRLSSETRNSHTIYLIAEALTPVSNQPEVLRALSQKLTDLPDQGGNWHAREALKRAIQNASVTEDILVDYQDRIPFLQVQKDASSISQLNPEQDSDRLKLLSALTNDERMIRREAIRVLSSIVLKDSEVLAAFLARIYAKDLGEVGEMIVSALGSMAHRDDVKNALLEQGCLDGKIDANTTQYYSPIRLATVKALSPFIDEPKVRHAFIKRLELDESSEVRCFLINLLAPQFEQSEDVRSLFFKAAKDELWRQHYHSGSDWQIAAIDKLGTFLHVPEVKSLLLELYEKSSYSVKFACLRALCSDPSQRFIEAGKIFKNCINSSQEVREEARRVLTVWTRYQEWKEND